MDQIWFEMPDVRKRSLESTVWIPLRAMHTVDSSGKRFYLDSREEFFGVGSLAVPMEKRDQAEKLGWMDIGISHDHHSCVQDKRYIPSDVYETYEGEVIGIPLVLSQRANTDEVREWHLHQDFVIALGLKREGDSWIAPDEGYIEIARLRRRTDQSPVLMEVRAEHLKDYLCARSMALYVTSYRNREETVKDANHILWEENPMLENKNGDRWEGRITEIHEGRIPYGVSTAVFHASRTDVDPEEDVPSFDFPSDENVEARSWTKTHTGAKLFRIQGELWRKEWVLPGELSPRIRGDELPPTVFFVTDSNGTQENKTTLQTGSRWLWFRPDVVMALVHRRGGALDWHTRDTGSARCSPDDGIHFGVNRIGLVTVYAKDIALLPEWQQRIWAGYNVSPEGGVSEELLASQMRADPADTQAPEEFLRRGIVLLNRITTEKFGFRLFHEHEQYDKLLTFCHRFHSIDQQGFFALAKDLARLTADSLDTPAIQKIVTPPKGTKWGSLKSLENLLSRQIAPEEARALLSPLVGIYELRYADAHLAGKEVMEALGLVPINQSLPFVFQGYQMLDACVSSLYRVASALEDWKMDTP